MRVDRAIHRALTALAPRELSPHPEYMTQNLSEVIEAGKLLDADEREMAALVLQQSEGDDQEAVGAAWNDVAERRLREVLNGEVEMVNGEETLALARSRIEHRR